MPAAVSAPQPPASQAATAHAAASHAATPHPATAERSASRERSRDLVLVGESSASIAHLERLYLTRAGFRVQIEASGWEALNAARSLQPAAVVLEIGLSGLNGTEILRALRAEGDPVPVVLVGDSPAETRDVADLHLAADCIHKPFSPRDLVAKVRGKVQAATTREHSYGCRTLGRLTINPDRRDITMDGQTVLLTNTEFQLLSYFVGHPNRVHTRQRLLAAVWGDRSGASARTVDVHVAQLRAKLGAYSPIRTVRGVGYLAAD